MHTFLDGLGCKVRFMVWVYFKIASNIWPAYMHTYLGYSEMKLVFYLAELEYTLVGDIDL